MKIIQNLSDFFRKLDTRLLLAGIMMFVIFILIVSIIAVIVFSIQKRKSNLQARLPKIDGVGEDSLTEPQFNKVDPLIVELIDEEDIETEEKNENDEIFVKALMMETKKYIPEKEYEMPSIESIKTDRGEINEKNNENKID